MLPTLFNYEGQQLRTFIKDGEPWFVAKDACDILEHSNSRMALERLDEDEKGVSSTDTLGGQQIMQVVNEPGLYSLILGSRKPEAKQFKRWITHEVIPTIRKTGTYTVQPQDSYMIEDPIERAKSWIKEAEQKKLLETTIEQQKPFVLFAESCIASNDSLLVREVAKLANKKGIGIGEKRLWQKLREWKVVNSKNEPYQNAMDAGWFEIRQGTYNTPYGSETYRTPRVMPKGQIYIIEKLKKEMQLVTA